MSKMCVLNYTLCFIGKIYLSLYLQFAYCNAIYNHCVFRNATTNIQKYSRKTKYRVKSCMLKLYNTWVSSFFTEASSVKKL